MTNSPVSATFFCPSAEHRYSMKALAAFGLAALALSATSLGSARYWLVGAKPRGPLGCPGAWAGARVPGGVGHADFAVPLGVEEIVEPRRCSGALHQFGVVKNADRRGAPC